MSPYLPAIATLIAAVLGGLFLFHIHSRNAQRAAAVKLRSAFSTALATIETALRHDQMDPLRPKVSASLRASFIQHAAAVEEYRAFVRRRDAPSYQRAWESYKQLAYDDNGVDAEFLAEEICPDAPLSAIRTRIQTLIRHAET